MIELTYTEAQHLLDTLEEVKSNPEAHDDISEEIEESVTIIKACMSDYWAKKHEAV